uniref:Uncharacterized protein n=1 Tax=Plectus sambesii TaxID=2011161 RepID=A0A914VHD5_9BILA
MGVPARAYFVSALVSLVGTLQLGYHHAVYNQPERAMQQYLNDSFWLSTGGRPSQEGLSFLWSTSVSMFAAGLLFGSVCCCRLIIDKLGRRAALIAAALVGLVGCAMQSGAFWMQATACWLLPMGRFVNGISSGIGTTSQAVFLSEIAPAAARGKLGALAPVFMATGTLIANLFGRHDIFGTYDLWWWLTIIPLISCLLFLSASWIIYESPKFLTTTKRDDDAAITSICFYNDSRTDAEAVLDLIKVESNDDQGLKGLINLVRTYPGYQNALLVAIGISLAVPFSGVFLMYTYLSEVALSAGMQQSSVDVLSLAYPCLDIICTLIGVRLIDVIGRRKLLLFGSWMVTGCLAIICACELLKDHRVYNGTGIQVALLIAVLVHVVMKSICISGVSFVLPYELFPTPVRAALASYVCAVGVDLGDLFLLFAYLPAKGVIGGYSLLILFILPTAAIALTLTYLMPETMGVPVAQMYETFTTTEEDENWYNADGIVSIEASPSLSSQSTNATTRIRDTPRLFTECEDAREKETPASWRASAGDGVIVDPSAIRSTSVERESSGKLGFEQREGLSSVARANGYRSTTLARPFMGSVVDWAFVARGLIGGSLRLVRANGAFANEVGGRCASIGDYCDSVEMKSSAGTSSASPSFSAISDKVQLPDGLVKFRLYPESQGRGDFGFRLSGNKTMGVYVTAILGGTIVEKDGHLQTSDQLLQCHDISLVGMSCDQVVKVLRLSFDLHGYAKLTVVKQWARGKGHSYRPHTGLPASTSQHHLSELAKDHRLKTSAASSDNANNISPMGASDKEIIRAEVHAEGAMLTEYTIIHDHHGAPTEIPTLQGVSGSRVELRLAASNLPNIPRESPRMHRPKRSGNGLKDGVKKEGTAQSRNSTKSDPDRKTSWTPKKRLSDDMRIKKISLSSQGIGESSDDPSLNFQPGKPNHMFSKENIKDFVRHTTPHVALRRQDSENDEVPLVSFDQLNKDNNSASNNYYRVYRKKGRSVSAESVVSEQSAQSAMQDQRKTSGSHEIKWNCPVCLEGAKKIRKMGRRLMSTHCGHVFCSACLDDIVKSEKGCPNCRAPVSSLTQCHPIFM